jgi:peptide/nickel transport system substrate-binding protein
MEAIFRRTMLKIALGSSIACSFVQSGVADEAPGDVLRVGMAAPNTTLDPHLLGNAPNNAVASHIFDALVTNDAKLGSAPGLASSWHTIDDTHWELKLREGVTFSDGTPFSAEDAIASLNRVTTLPSLASFRTYTRSIAKLSAPNPHTLLIETRAPDPLLPNALSRVRIISAKFKDAPSADFDSGRAAIGTGPFVLKSYTPGSEVVLLRNEAWWGRKLPWAAVTLKMATDTGGRLASLLAGDLDVIEAVPAESSDMVTRNDRFHLIRGISSRLVYLGLDHKSDVAHYITDADGKPLPSNPLKDPRVRKALDMAINRQAIVDRVMLGNAVIASQFLPTGGPGTAPDIKPTVFDPAAAKLLLAAAGYPKGFRVTLHGSNDRYINDSKVVQAVAQMFTRIGIETRAEVMPWSVYAGKSAVNDFSIFLASWGVNTGETSNPLSATVATYDPKAGLGVANAGRYSNAEVDAKLEQAMRTMDDSARNQILGQACSIAFHDNALLPLHHEVSVWATRKDVTYETRADQYTLAAGVARA